MGDSLSKAVCGVCPVCDSCIRYCKVFAKSVALNFKACGYGLKLLANKGIIKPGDNMGEGKG